MLKEVKAYVVTTSQASFISFEKKLPCRGAKSRIVKEKIRKKWIENGFQPMPLPLLFVKPEVLNSISQKIKKKPTVIEIDISELMSFNSLKEHLINLYIK